MSLFVLVDAKQISTCVDTQTNALTLFAAVARETADTFTSSLAAQLAAGSTILTWHRSAQVTFNTV